MVSIGLLPQAYLLRLRLFELALPCILSVTKAPVECHSRYIGPPCEAHINLFGNPAAVRVARYSYEAIDSSVIGYYECSPVGVHTAKDSLRTWKLLKIDLRFRYPKAYPLYMSSGPTYTSATSSISATTSAQALVSSAPTATPASHAQALVIGVRMLGFNANYIHKIASSDQASATQITPADAFEDLSRVDHFDILALLVDIGLARTTGWRAHVLSRKTDTLRKVETEADFAQFNRALEDKARTAPVLMGGTQDISIKNGKYVVVTSTLPAAKDLDTSDAGNAADNPDESWAML